MKINLKQSTYTYGIRLKIITKMKILKNKKAIFFSTDALVALFIIMMTLLVVYISINAGQKNTQLESDTLKVMSELKINNIDNSYVQSLISQGEITNPNNSILEQIGEFYINESIESQTMASALAEQILDELDTNENIGIWYGTDLIASKNSTPIDNAQEIILSSQTITGLQKGESAKGYSSRAYLSKADNVQYYYFGGYIGDGNISMQIQAPGEVIDMEFEIAINNDYDLYINNQFSGHYEKSQDEYTPQTYLPEYESNFQTGTNLIEFKSSNNLYIAGGYLKLTFNSSSDISSNKKYNFMGIDGLINIYDGIYIPEELTSMNVFLNYTSNVNMFLNIANKTIFNESSETQTQETITNSEIQSKLNYEDLTGKTVPIRLGLEQVQQQGTGGGIADIVFVIDSTGSMGDEIQDVYTIAEDFADELVTQDIDYRLGIIEFKDYPKSSCGNTGCDYGWGGWSCCLSNDCSIPSVCESCGGTYNEDNADFPSKIHLFNSNEFTTSSIDFKTKINTLTASGGADWPESHLTAINDSIYLNWRENSKKVIIVLTDAQPHAKDCYIYDSDTYESCYEGPEYIQDVIEDLVTNDITSYYVSKDTTGSSGGLCDNRPMADNMTNETGGKFYAYTESQGVQDIIIDIGREIVEVTYAEQTATSIGDIYSYLSPTSYIELNYNNPTNPYGLVITLESENFNSSGSLNLTLPENATFLEATTTSYSGPRWTKTLTINNQEEFNIEAYGNDYIELGDPFNIQIPNSTAIQKSSIIQLLTGTSPADSYPISTASKIIYKIIKSFQAYSPVVSKAQGCEWNISLENNEIIQINTPSTYTGNNKCSFTPENIIYDVNDAIQTSVYNLLEKLDFNNNNKIDFSISSQNLQFDSTELSGIPYTYETEIQVRIWR